MSLRDLMGADEPEVTDETEEAPEAVSPEAHDEDADVSPEASDETDQEPQDPDESFVTSADIDPRLIVRSIQVDTAEEEFRATSAQGFDTLIAALRDEARPYRVINRFTGRVYDSFLDFVPDAQAE